MQQRGSEQRTLTEPTLTVTATTCDFIEPKSGTSCISSRTKVNLINASFFGLGMRPDESTEVNGQKDDKLSSSENPESDGVYTWV